MRYFLEQDLKNMLSPSEIKGGNGLLWKSLRQEKSIESSPKISNLGAESQPRNQDTKFGQHGERKNFQRGERRDSQSRDQPKQKFQPKGRRDQDSRGTQDRVYRPKKWGQDF